MKEEQSLTSALPDVILDQPHTDWIHAESVTGPYGITAAVDHFDDVLDWQEFRRSLSQGYYRLIHPPRVQKFKARLESKYPGFHAVLFTSGPLGHKETRELQAVNGFSEELMIHEGLPEALDQEGVHILNLIKEDVTAGVALLKDGECARELHERNRRRGGSLSARAVAHLLEEPDAETYSASDSAPCRETLCALEQADHALFYPSGMAAVTAVLDEALTADTHCMLVMGNVYRDTHLILEEQTWAYREVNSVFLDTHDLDGLRQRIGDEDVAGVFIETITNPLIEIPDLPGIADICHQAGKPLLVDSTMASPLNVSPLTLGADVVIHSTSKYLSGHNSHGGGVVLTKDPKWAECLRITQDAYEYRLSVTEYTCLLNGLSTFEARMARFNANGEALAGLLRSHPAVETVYYGNQGRPEWLHGLGSVVSCNLKDAGLQKLETFYNQPLEGLIKAPSLGSDQTLFCPYVLLAYYEKSEAYLADCNLPKYLLRFAAGCEEDFSGVLASVKQALDALNVV